MLPRHRAVVLIAGLMASGTTILALACGELGPSSTGGTRIAVGDTVSGHVSPGDSPRSYVFSASANGFYGVFFQTVSGGALILHAGYPAGTGFDLRGWTASRPGNLLRDNATEVFGIGQGGDVTVQVLSDNPQGGDFRFAVVNVNQTPEHRPGHIAVGDTVTGEDFETIVDVDTFSLAGQAGQTVIATLQAQGTDSGTIELRVINPGIRGLASVTSTQSDS